MASEIEKGCIAQEIDEARKRVQFLEKALKEQNDRFLSEQAKVGELEKDLRDAEFLVRRLTELQLIKKGVPKSVADIRDEILVKMKQARRRDITIAKKEILEKEIKNLRKRLQNICDHPFVFSYDSYSGSQHNEYEDAYPGSCVCVICGFSQEFWEGVQAKENFVLKEASNRLVKRDLREPNQRHIFPGVFLEISKVLEAFEHSAGRMNISWPKE